MKTPTIALLAVFASVSPLLGQDTKEPPVVRSTTRGFVLGLHLNGSSLRLSEDGADTESGGGMGLMLGYGVSHHVTVLARADVAEVDYSGGGGDSYMLTHVDLGARYSFGSYLRALRPYAELSLQGAAVTDQVEGSDISISGGGVGVGGGVEYFFSPKLALDVGLGLTAGTFSHAEVDGMDAGDPHEDFSSSRFNLGVSWHP